MSHSSSNSPTRQITPESPERGPPTHEVALLHASSGSCASLPPLDEEHAQNDRVASCDSMGMPESVPQLRVHTGSYTLADQSYALGENSFSPKLQQSYPLGENSYSPKMTSGSRSRSDNSQANHHASRAARGGSPKAQKSGGHSPVASRSVLKVQRKDVRSSTGYASLDSEGDGNKQVVWSSDAMSRSREGDRSHALVNDGTQTQQTWMSNASDWSHDDDNRVFSPSQTVRGSASFAGHIMRKVSAGALSAVSVVSDESANREDVELTAKQLREKTAAWQRESLQKCAQLLLMASLIFGLARLLDLWARASATDDCTLWRAGAPRSTGGLLAALSAEWSCWLALACLSLRGLYWPTLAAHYSGLGFLLLLAVGFPLLPVEPTFEEWWSFRQCRRDDDLSWRSGIASCGPQGPKSMAIVLVTMCMSPHVVHQMRSTLAFMCSLVVGYLIASLIYLYGFDIVHYYNEFDILACVALLLAAAGLTAYRKFVMMKTHEHMRRVALRNEVATKKLLDVLQDFLPDHVITPMLANPSAAIAEQVPRASVLFLVITDFEAHMSKRSPVQLLDFLNTLFARIDRICVDAKVTKIETVGEEYVAAVGVKPEDRATASEFERVLSRLLVAALVIFSIQDEQQEKDDPSDPLHGVRFRMGVHTGPVVAGVIGQKLPRFRLFGDTINTAARMMQKGVDGELQFGEETRRHLPAWAVYKSRGAVEMKGKGSMDVFLLDKSAGDAQNTWEQHRSFAHRKTGRSSLDNIISKTLSERAIRDMSSRTPTMESMRNGTARFCRWLKRGLKDGVKHVHSSEFGDTQHLQWLKEFYQARMASRLGPRTTRHVLVLLLSTSLEAVVAGVFEAGATGQTEGVSKLLLFLLLRLLLLVMVVGWAFAARSKQRIASSPRKAEVCRLIHVCLQMVLQLVAYSLLTEPEVDDVGLDLSADQAMEEAQKEGLRTPLWQMAFLLWYSVTVLDLRLRLKPTVLFVAFSLMVLVVLPFSVPAVRRLSTTLQIVSVLVTGVVGVHIARLGQKEDYSRFETEAHVAAASQRIDSILSRLMPPLVAAQVAARASKLSASMAVKQQQHASHYKKATIACSDLVGFTKIASTRTPVEVVEMVSDLFARFDQLSDFYMIYKIETVGDAYIAGQAVRPLTAIYRPMSVVVFGFEMVRVAREWASEKGVPVDCRVGVHTGECVGGVVGVEMKRYHLFGKLLAGVESLESTAPTGKVHISRACEKALVKQLSEDSLSDQIVVYAARKEAQLQTSKGDPVEYEEVGGGPTFVVNSCKPELYDPRPPDADWTPQAELQLPDQVPDTSPDPSPIALVKPSADAPCAPPAAAGGPGACKPSPEPDDKEINSGGRAMLVD